MRTTATRSAFLNWRKLILLGFLLTSCSVTKYIPEGQSLYNKADIKIEPQGRIPSQHRAKTRLEAYVPKTDKSLWGWRPTVWLYYKGKAETKTKGLIKKFSREPILMKDINPELTAKKMEGNLNNNGYFRSQVKPTVETKDKKSKVTYTVFLNPPFRVAKLNWYIVDSTRLPKLYNDIVDKSFIKPPRQRFNVERMQAEQVRIEAVMENHGYYYFDDQHLIFEADTTIGKRRVELDLKLEKDVPSQARRPFRLSRINVFPDYELSQSQKAPADTLFVDGYTYIDSEKSFRPNVITRVINLQRDSLYSRVDHDYSLSHLMGLRTFKFVNIKYEPDPADSTALHANIYLTPLLKKSLRFQVQAVSKSNNFVGPGVELTFTNRNFMRGAELLQFKLHSSYEVQISRQQAGALNALELGGETSLTIPRFIAPIYIPYRSAKYLPQTQIKVGYNLQNRLQYYSLTSTNAAYGYLWRESTIKTHELFPIDISYVRSGKTSPEFEKLLASNPYLANSFQNQFILGGRYSYTLNTQIKEDIEQNYDRTAISKSNFYFNGALDVSGNLLRGIQTVGVREEEQGQFLGQPYSQYVKVDLDFRYYYDFNKKSKLATRLFVGSGYAYGNSTTMPYIKQYGVGGSNSVRAFPARSIGPGTYNVRTDPNINTKTYFVDQRGDIKLEGNVEYRFDIVKSVKGALFVDAGNIWLRKEDPERPGSGFSFNTLAEQLAVGTGAGVRLDLSFFVLRLDAAFPLRKPFLPAGSRWTTKEENFGSAPWFRDNLVLNIAIGYPF
jgi:outer membrane protein insertion porin family